MREWMTGKPFVVTAEQAKTRWGSGFCCKICDSDKFKEGDTARWVYANSTPGATTGNFFVCAKCDRPNDQLIAIAKTEIQTAIRLAKKWLQYDP